MPLPVLLRALTATIALCLCAGAFAKTITVQQGESLWGLAQKHGTDVETLRQLNNLTSDLLKVGQVLSLPSTDTDGDTEPATVTVRPGDTLYEIALRHGVTVEALIAYNDLEGTVIHPGQELVLAPGETAPEPLEVVLGVGDSLWVLSRRYDTTIDEIAAANGIDRNATLRVGDRMVIPGRYAASDVDVGGPAPVEVVVTANDTLWGIAVRYDSNVSAIMSANNLTSDRLQVGQRLRIVPGAEVNATRAAVPTPILSDAAGAPMVWPLNGVITSRFGYRQLRVSGSNFHTGLDIDGDTGDPIVAAVAGTVTHSGWRGGYGYLVIVTNGNTDYYYAHASELLVDEGTPVKVGQLIARVGSTGNSTGPHLHFEVRVDGDPVDPLPILETTAAAR
ncbi:MAG: LysM peptidoglycan-binding domain-containing protein [Trueperaceae bacterium]